MASRTPSLPLTASRVAMSRFILTRGHGKGTRPFWVIDGRGLWSPRAVQLCLSRVEEPGLASGPLSLEGRSTADRPAEARGQECGLGLRDS